MARKRKFRSELLDGHKGPAVIVPFDPAKAWDSRPVEIASRAYGRRPGHLVRGTINGHPFESWIGHRWGRFFIMVDPELRRAARVGVGEVVEVEVAPRSPSGKAVGPGSRKPRKKPRPSPRQAPAKDPRASRGKRAKRTPPKRRA